MEVRVQIPFEELLSAVQQLTEHQKEKLKNELDKKATSVNMPRSRLTELLLNAPVFTDEQLKLMEENRNAINQWRTKI